MVQREPKQERSARTREAILRAGAEVFAEVGFAGASVNKIARRANLTLGALYFHFESKEQLAREIVQAQPTQITLPATVHGLQGAVDTTIAWATQLLNDPMLLAGARLVMDQEYFVDAEKGNSHQQWVEVLLPFLYEAAQAGELKPDVDVEALARLVVNAATGAQMNAQLDTGRQDLPDRMRQMWRFLVPLVAPEECVLRAVIKL
ncbi:MULTISPECIES: ScbR family autoregulator-binding transcription factor [Streptomyces]|uniref:Gamma-butyrolactone-binding protein n=1 Tax=Streptomyces xanthochromogenes TaxID=67384 RepID=A0ABQ3B090_9ACTN|nr:MULTISPECIES: ScbR family autoregulator-binding transcription factor [Streptomyces]MYV95920.1 TetR family transcriptional regulator [Streptomyces sp. SID1034]GGY71321.1 gamma-butyrolactone-binding protein [Streptomyces xanthochromogenes]